MKRVIALYAASLLASAAIAAPVYAQDNTNDAPAPTEIQPGQSSGSDAATSADANAGADVNADETTASIDITTDQQTELRTIFSENQSVRSDADVSVTVGAAVPATIELQPLPPRVVEIVPTYKDYQYFTLADGRVVIVEPASKKVVYILS